MKFIFYDKSTLLETLQTGKIFNTNHHPITYHRALSHINNPRLGENDIILIVAKKGKKLCGYIGILPDYIFSKKKIKIGILTAWWVNPEFKSTGVGYILLLNASKYYKNKIYVSDFSDSADAVYSKTNLFINIDSDYKTKIFFQLNEKSNNKLFQLLKYLINRIFDTGQKAWCSLNKNLFKDYNLFIANSLSKEDKKFINTFTKESLFKRNIEEFNWSMQFPWILESNTINKNYYFSSNAKIFRTNVIRIFSKKDSSMIALFLFKQRDDSLSIPYSFIRENYKNITSRIIMHKILSMNVNHLTIQDDSMLDCIKNSTLNHFIKMSREKRNIIISKKLYSNDIKNKKIYLGDGDLLFT